METTTRITFRIWNAYRGLRDREDGQTMAEYGVVLGVVTVATVGAFTFLGDHVDTALRTIAARF